MLVTDRRTTLLSLKRSDIQTVQFDGFNAPTWLPERACKMRKKLLAVECVVELTKDKKPVGALLHVGVEGKGFTTFFGL